MRFSQVVRQSAQTKTCPTGLQARKWRHRPLRWRLGIIVVATVLPLFAYDLYGSYRGYISARQEITGQAMFAARTLASVIESDLHGGETAMQVLGTADSLRAGDYAAFRKQAEAVIARHFPGANILLLRADGQQVVNTAVPPGEPLPVRKAMENQNPRAAIGASAGVGRLPRRLPRPADHHHRCAGDRKGRREADPHPGPRGSACSTRSSAATAPIPTGSSPSSTARASGWRAYRGASSLPGAR